MTPYERDIAERLQAEATTIPLPPHERWSPKSDHSTRSWLPLAAVAAVVILAVALASSQVFTPIVPARPGRTTPPSASPGDVAALLARPVVLPTVGAGAACPVTPVSPDATVGVGSPRGGTHFYLGGPLPQGGDPFNKMAYVTRDTIGPIILRGGRIDTDGRIEFSGDPADPSAAPLVKTAPGGSWSFYRAIVLTHSPDAFYVYPAEQGCYAIQIDGANFEETIIIEAKPLGGS